MPARLDPETELWNAPETTDDEESEARVDGERLSPRQDLPRSPQRGDGEATNNPTVQIVDVERPSTPVRGTATSMRARLIATATTGKALQIALNGIEYRAMQARLGATIAGTGLDVRTCRPEDGSAAIIAWAVKKEPTR